MAYIRETTPSFLRNYDSLKNALLQRFNPPENCFSYRAAFNNRTLNEDETLQAYAWDLKLLAIRAYPDHTLQLLEHIIVQQFIKGLGIKNWSDHVLFHCPHTLQEAIDIALERKTFNGCDICSQHYKYNISDICSNLPRCNSSDLKAVTSYSRKTQRYKPYNLNQVKNTCTKSHLRYCKAYQSVTLFGVLEEHKQLQTLVSTEQHYACDLVEIIVEVPKPLTSASNLKSMTLSQDSCSVKSDVVLVSEETNQSLSCHVSCTVKDTFSHHKPETQQVSSDHSFQPSCLLEAVSKAVIILKDRVHDNSRGDYSPNILTCKCVSSLSVTQTQGYFIRLQKRDFPD